MSITKPCTQLQPAPYTSTQLHPPPPSSLQHPQQYLNQNIVRNWAISPNLGRKIKSCPFWLKIGTHGILEVLIPNLDLDFWHSDRKNQFLGKFGPKNSKLSILSESWCTWYLKNPESRLRFLTFGPQKSIFRQIWAQKFKIFRFVWKLVLLVSQGSWFWI